MPVSYQYPVPPGEKCGLGYTASILIRMWVNASYFDAGVAGLHAGVGSMNQIDAWC